MRPAGFWATIAAGCIVIVWLFVDRWIAIRARALAVSRIEYDGGDFVIDGVKLTFAGVNNLRSDVSLSSDASNHVVVSAGGESFTLGPRTSAADASGRPEIEFAPEPADRVFLAVRESAFAWPALFEIDLLGGRAPWWKQAVYYRLLWQKPSGRRLEMRWRYERRYFQGSGWTEPAMLWNSQTGLLGAEIGGN